MKMKINDKELEIVYHWEGKYCCGTYDYPPETQDIIVDTILFKNKNYESVLQRYYKIYGIDLQELIYERISNQL